MLIDLVAKGSNLCTDGQIQLPQGGTSTSHAPSSLRRRNFRANTKTKQLRSEIKTLRERPHQQRRVITEVSATRRERRECKCERLRVGSNLYVGKGVRVFRIIINY